MTTTMPEIDFTDVTLIGQTSVGRRKKKSDSVPYILYQSIEMCFVDHTLNSTVDDVKSLVISAGVTSQSS